VAKKSSGASGGSTSFSQFKQSASSGYKSQLTSPLLGAVSSKGAEHATVILNLSTMATIAIGAVVTAEVNHTRPKNSVWTWRVVEMISSLPVLAYNGHQNTLGRLALGVFLGSLIESFVDSTPGLTGAVVPVPADSQVIWY